MKKLNLALIFIFIIGALFLNAERYPLNAEEVQITTYYPAPMGVYKQLQAEKYYGYPLTLVPGVSQITPPIYYGLDPLYTSYLSNLNATGWVGVGTPEAVGLLDVSHDAGLTHDLFVNATTGNVGIGISNPGAKLEVATTYTDPVFEGFRLYNPSVAGAEAHSSRISSYFGSGTVTPYEAGYIKFSQTSDFGASLILATNDNSSGSPIERMYISKLGNVGIGTMGPIEQLHVYEAGTGNIWRGRAVFGNQNVVSLAGVYNNVPIVGAHNATLTAWEALYLNTSDGLAGANVIMSGNVGIGTASPGGKLEVNIGNNDNYFLVNNDNNIGLELRSGTTGGRPYIDFSNDATSDYDMRIILTSGGDLQIRGSNFILGPQNTSAYKLLVSGDVNITGGLYHNGVFFTPWSDMKFKKNIERLYGVSDKIKKINGVKFEWRIDEFPEKRFPQGRQIGIIAQEVEKEFPELVKVDDDGNKLLVYENFTAVLLEAIKEQQKQIEDLNKKIVALETKINQIQ